MSTDLNKPRGLLRRIDNMVQIAAFFVALLFLGGFALYYFSGNDDAEDAVTTTLVFGAPLPGSDTGPSATGEPAPLSDEEEQDEEADLGAFGEPMSENPDEDFGGWGTSSGSSH